MATAMNTRRMEGDIPAMGTDLAWRDEQAPWIVATSTTDAIGDQDVRMPVLAFYAINNL